jgi:SAM-dependent methyltransferase
MTTSDDSRRGGLAKRTDLRLRRAAPDPVLRLARRVRATSRRAGVRVERAVFPPSSGAAEHWQRVVLNRAVDEFIESLGPEHLSAAEISGDTHADRPWHSYVSLNFPDFDLCAPLGDQGQFDVVICEQVLEHVEDPWAAARNLLGLCVPGGRVIVAPPFLIRVHELRLFAMNDYWRFTPRGLGQILTHCGLEVDAQGAWGNRQCVVGNFSSWASFRPWHSLRNESDFPVQVWAFAHRPG